MNRVVELLIDRYDEGEIRFGQRRPFSYMLLNPYFRRQDVVEFKRLMQTETTATAQLRRACETHAVHLYASLEVALALLPSCACPMGRELMRRIKDETRA